MDLATLAPDAFEARAALIVAGFSLVFSATAWWFASRSFAASIHRTFKAFRIDHLEFRGEMEDQASRMHQHKVDMTALYQSVDGVLGTIEKKRRSTAASESKSAARVQQVEEIAPVPEADVNNMSRLDLERLARNRGMM